MESSSTWLPPDSYYRLHRFNVQCTLQVSCQSSTVGALDLRSCIAVVNHDGKIKGHSHVLNLVMSNLMVHHLVAHSEKDRDEWVSAMNEFLFKKQQVGIYGACVGTKWSSLYIGCMEDTSGVRWAHVTQAAGIDSQPATCQITSMFV